MLDKSKKTGDSNFSEQEIARFDALADSWWDPEGKYKTALDFNRARLNVIKAQIEKEIADIFNYLLKLTDMLDIDLEKAALNKIDENEMILDIGSKTISSIEEKINNSKTVLWNGPAGYFENPNFQNGTKKILEIISQKTKNDKIFSVAGGGETVAAINKFKKFDSFTFVSTAGGAFLEYLEGKTLPAIKALNQNV